MALELRTSPRAHAAADRSDSTRPTAWEALRARNRALQQELATEREGALRLRRALELAASYFHAPLNDAHETAAWEEIVSAIHSAAGRTCPCCGQTLPTDCLPDR